MNDYKKIETKLWNEVSMLTSGVLTSLIYGLLSEATYTLDIEGKLYEIKSTGMNPWCAIALVVLTFFALWACISLLIPVLLRIRKRFVYDKVKKISAKELMKVLDETSNTVKKLYPVFNTESGDLIRLYSRDIARIILLLHRYLLPQNIRLRKRIEAYFRYSEHASIITIDKKVSGYELAANLKLLKRMVTKLTRIAGNDALLSKDCKEMSAALADIEQLKPVAILLEQKENPKDPTE